MTKGITIGAIAHEAIEANDTYLLNINTITKANRVIIAVGQWMDKSMPKDVAIPLPPLNFKKIGHI